MKGDVHAQSVTDRLITGFIPPLYPSYFFIGCVDQINICKIKKEQNMPGGCL